jgi:hypothetical protein
VMLGQALPHRPEAGIPGRQAAERPRPEAAWAEEAYRVKRPLEAEEEAEHLLPARARPAESPSPLLQSSHFA